jgi:hypothetical protein
LATSSTFAVDCGTTPRAQRGLAVGARDVAQVLGGELDFGDFAESHEVAALAATDDQLAEVTSACTGQCPCAA